MKIDWAHVKQAVERGIHSAENGERGGVRVHTGSAERMLKGARDDLSKQIIDHVHHARNSLDTTRAIEYLKKALELLEKVPS
jgi:alkylhydroperoxidase/carboxymuconolactone decarboxylase family protein YurZ